MSAKKRRKITSCKLVALPSLISLRSSECSYCSHSAHHQPGSSSFSAELMPGRPAPLYVMVRLFLLQDEDCLKCSFPRAEFLGDPFGLCLQPVWVSLDASPYPQVFWVFPQISAICKPITFSRSLLNILNKTGPIVDPRGTAFVTGIQIRYDLLIMTLWS